MEIMNQYAPIDLQRFIVPARTIDPSCRTAFSIEPELKPVARRSLFFKTEQDESVQP
jgi:hypothetical protein